jgi:hypothetical protein
VELHQGAVTGSLKLERAPLQKAVYFRDGQILFAASNDPKDQLASILVEEGKLGPDQMQVAQARVTPGNPLAKVLTELGYISQRELADAARIKVEKILTDLYTWKEGVYQFATKSLPKGAIDLELSTPRLLFASIRRVQDREWVLRQLGSLDSVLAPTPAFDSFLRATEPEPLAEQVLKLADGVRTVKQIGAMSSLGEFEVCKVLAAALVGGGVSRNDAAASAPSANVEAFSFPSEAERSSFPPPPAATYGSSTADAPSEVSPEPSYDTVYQAAAVRPSPPVEESERTVFEPVPVRPSPPSPPPVPPLEPLAEGASELLIDEPEPASESPPRNPPRPKGRRGGGGGSGSAPGILKWVVAAALLAGVGYAAYAFVWPLVAGRPKPATSAGAITTTTSAPGSDAASATTGAETTIPEASSPTPPVSAARTTAPEAATTSIAPRTSAPTTIPRDPRPTPPSGAAKPPTPTPPKPAGSDGRSLLTSGNLAAAARAFQSELSSIAGDKFTLALGLYCNEENVERLVSNAQGSRDLYLLPTTSQGRACYRVTWGLYDSREAADTAKGSVPVALRSGDVAPVPVSRFLR